MQEERTEGIPQELKEYQEYLLMMLLVFDAFCK